MLKVTIQQKIDGLWVTTETPRTTTGKVNMMKALADTQSIIKVQTSCMECYFCGTQKLFEQVQSSLTKKGQLAMTLEDAHEMIELEPDVFVHAIQAFYTPEHVEKVFPPSKGWTKPKEDE
jgi:hypothetical protein